MKKATLLAFVLVISPIMIFGLDFNLGIKFGTNIGWIGGEDFVNDLEAIDDLGRDQRSLSLGFSAGSFLTFGFIDFFAMQIEILYSNIGGSYSYLSGGVEVDGVQNASVIEFPIFLKARISLAKGHLYLLVGPELIFILGVVRVKEEGGGSVATAGYVPDNDTLIGFSGGIGYEYPFESGKVSAEIKFSRNFTEIFNDYKSYQNAITLMTGYAFAL